MAGFIQKKILSSVTEKRAKVIGAVIGLQVFFIIATISLLTFMTISLIFIFTIDNIAVSLVIGIITFIMGLIFAIVVSLTIYRSISKFNYNKYFIELTQKTVQANVPEGMVEFTRDSIESIEPMIRYYTREYKSNVPEGFGLRQNLKKKAMVLASQATDPKNLYVFNLKNEPLIKKGGIFIQKPMNVEGRKRVILDIPDIGEFLKDPLDDFYKKSTKNRLPPYPIPQIPKQRKIIKMNERRLFPHAWEKLPPLDMD